MHIKIQTDQEILTDLIDQLTKVDDDDNRHRILTDLEYYLHQVCLFFSIFCLIQFFILV
jgi:hypothetical protein